MAAMCTAPAAGTSTEPSRLKRGNLDPIAALYSPNNDYFRGETPMMARILIAFAIVYLILALALGLHMGLIADYRLGVVYAHFIALGWLSLGLVAILYLNYPELTGGIFAWAHFWLYLIGLPLMLIGLTMTQLDAFATGHTLALIGAFAMLLGVVALGLNCWVNLPRRDRALHPQP
jgi:hypothetical protein